MGAEKTAPLSLSKPSNRATRALAAKPGRIPSYDMIPPIGLSEGREIATRRRAGQGTLPQAGRFLAKSTPPCGEPLLPIKSYTL